MNDVCLKAYQEGFEAFSSPVFSCPYNSASGVYRAWADGFVMASSLDIIPQGTPDYLRGRIAFKNHIDLVDEKAEISNQNWFSGWLTQKNKGF